MEGQQPSAPLIASAPAAASKNYFQRTIGMHPGATAVIMGVLVLLILVLSYALVHYKGQCPKSGFEGLAAGNGGSAPAGNGGSAPASPCGPGETAVTYQDPDGGAMMTYCRSTDALPGPATVCGRGWDPAATAEAQALATVGSLQHDSYGEKKLQGAINAAYDGNVGLSDDQLAALMHQGGTP